MSTLDLPADPLYEATMVPPLKIWCNARFPDDTLAFLRQALGPRPLLLTKGASVSNLQAGGTDPLLAQADIAFGQPDPGQLLQLTNIRWTHLTSAGYTRYDRSDLRQALSSRQALLTNSSSVYAEPCAQHVLAMMLSLSRQLPQCHDEQREDPSWQSALHRIRSRLLRGQRALMLGFGAIGHRLAELLAPFAMNITAVRRNVSPHPVVRIEPVERTDDLLGWADHIVNLLPENPSTKGFVNAARFGRMKKDACFYNIGRGTTVDQEALTAALKAGQLAAACLDVTDPEPLPRDNALWSLPNCFITPHTAGGHEREFHRLVDHFLNNLYAFEEARTLTDRII